MKNLKLFTFAFLLGISSLSASEIIEDKEEIRNQVVVLFDDAKFEADKDFRVTFTFTFNSRGQIVVMGVDSAREDIKDYIRKNVNYKKLENPGIPNQTYRMPINVQIIS